MKCPKCGKDMKSGYLQTTKIVAFNKRKHKISLNPECEDDVMLLLKLIFHRQDTQELLKKLLEREKPETP